MDNAGRFLASISALLLVAYAAQVLLGSPVWAFLVLVFSLPGYVIGFWDGVKYDKSPRRQ